MQVCVFGATGRTGRLVLTELLARGHSVTAFVRDRARLGPSADRVRVVEGQVADAAAIAEAVRGSDAVIVAVAAGNGVLTRLAEQLVPAMKAAGIARIVSLVGAGVAEPGDPVSLGRSVMLTLLRLFARHVLADAERHAALLRVSGLDYTLVRPPRLADGDKTGRIRAAPALRLGPGDSVSRADLAAFMVDCAEEGRFIRAAPMVAAATR